MTEAELDAALLAASDAQYAALEAARDAWAGYRTGTVPLEARRAATAHLERADAELLTLRRERVMRAAAILGGTVR